MNLALLRSEVWSKIGEPPDLDPSSDTSYSSGPLLDFVVNEGQRQVATWRDVQRERTYRIRSLYNWMFYQTTYIAGTLDQSSSSSTIILPSGDVGNQDGRYEGWVAAVGSETKLITSYTGSIYTGSTHSAWGTAPTTGDSYKLYKNFELLLPSDHAWVDDHISLPVITDRSRATGNLVEVLKLYDLESQSNIGKANRTEGFPVNMLSASYPTEWYRFGNRIVYNYNVDSERWIKMEYFRTPTELVEDSDEPEVPDFLQWGIVLWGVMWGFMRHNEPAMKWSASQDFNNFMRERVSQYDTEFYREDDHGSLRMA